jgi:F0F1-type ATP synthase membrane subunit b/b'
MNTSDSRAGTQSDNQEDIGRPEQDFQHLKEDVTEVLGDARQQVDAQFGQYRDTAADQIEALAKGAKSFVSELESKDTLGMSDYLSDMAQSMSGLAGSLRGKSAEQLLHDSADLARNNPALFIAGSIALGFGLSRFLKAGSSPAAAFDASDPATGSSVPPSGGFGAHQPYETSVASRTDPGPGLATGSTPASSNEQGHPSDFAAPSTPGSTSFKGEL